MSQNEGAIPKLVGFITFFILGVAFNVPDEFNIGVMILEAFRPVAQTVENPMAVSVVDQYILYIHLLGIFCFILDIVIIISLFRKKQYW